MPKPKTRHLANGKATSGVRPASDPYRQLLETATRDEARLARKFAVLKPRCDDIERRLSEVRRVKAALEEIFRTPAEGEGEPRIVFNVPRTREGSRRFYREGAARVLRAAGKPLPASEIVKSIRADPGLASKIGPNAYQTIYEIMKRAPSQFRHQPGGLFTLMDGGGAAAGAEV